MSLTTNNSKPLAPSEISDLIVAPTFEKATASQAATVMEFATPDLRVPIIEDGSSAFVSEGSEIAISEPTFTEAVIVPKKVAQLVPVTNELLADAAGDIKTLIGESMTRSLARRIDAQFWAATTGPLGFKAIGSVADVLTATSNLSNLDVWIEAIADLAAHGHTATAAVVSPDVFKALATLKTSAGSNVTLLQASPTEAAQLRVAGLPVILTDALPANTAYVTDASKVLIGVRTSDVQIDVDQSVFFSSDRAAIRATLRVGVAYPAPTAIVRITLT
ncbi:phage major capsid protein [Williamsia herbipolensis]|uniref:phage major capsid protein n=1 Tax=Williamsia herbipolensis TaxID=1603258 RepID=UPI0005F88BCC|nr:phage major capsid protein [Williamsia herbipolensis]